MSTEETQQVGVVRIGPHEFTLPVEEAQHLFLVASRAAAKSRPFVASPDLTMWAGAAPISLQIDGAFAEDYNPAGDVERLVKRRQGVIL